MTGHDGTVAMQALLPVAEACGQSSEQLRSCLRRLVAEGLFEREGTGQAAVYAATEAGMAALGQSVERQRLAYAQDAAGRGWDRHWRLVAFAIPEVRRAARDAFRDRLSPSAAPRSTTASTCRPTVGQGRPRRGRAARRRPST